MLVIFCHRIFITQNSVMVDSAYFWASHKDETVVEGVTSDSQRKAILTNEKYWGQ